MKHIYALLFYFFLVSTHCAWADNETEQWLDKLDNSLAQREQFEKKRVDRIDNLKKQLAEIQNNKSGDRYYELVYGLYNEYKSYCYDSAHHYADECLVAAQLADRSDRIVEAKHAIAFSLISAGILTEAGELLKSIDRNQLSGQQLAD